MSRTILGREKGRFWRCRPVLSRGFPASPFLRPGRPPGVARGRTPGGGDLSSPRTRGRSSSIIFSDDRMCGFFATPKETRSGQFVPHPLQPGTSTAGGRNQGFRRRAGKNGCACICLYYNFLFCSPDPPWKPAREPPLLFALVRLLQTYLYFRRDTFPGRSPERFGLDIAGWLMLASAAMSATGGGGPERILGRPSGRQYGSRRGCKR